MSKTCKKVSIGIILFRSTNRGAEVLLVKNRITHAYNEFVFGKYKYNNTSLQRLFDHMSVQEKLFLNTLDFNKIWSYIWLNVPGCEDSKRGGFHEFYIKCRNRFEKFISDRGRRLKHLIQISKSSEPGYEPPKGRKDSGETDIDTAIRETWEETNIKKSRYTLIWEIDPIPRVYQTDTCAYISKYYMGFMNPNEDTSVNINFNNPFQAAEIVDLKWASMYDLKYLKMQSEKVTSAIKFALKLLKKKGIYKKGQFITPNYESTNQRIGSEEEKVFRNITSEDQPKNFYERKIEEQSDDEENGENAREIREYYDEQIESQPFEVHDSI